MLAKRFVKNFSQFFNFLVGHLNLLTQALAR